MAGKKPAAAREAVPAGSAPAVAMQGQTPAQKAVTQVTISDGKKLTVPSLVGLSVRKVIEAAAAAGLDVEVSGDGTAREQAPAPGTQVATGTKIVVRCGR